MENVWDTEGRDLAVSLYLVNKSIIKQTELFLTVIHSLGLIENILMHYKIFHSIRIQVVTWNELVQNSVALVLAAFSNMV